MTDDQLASNLRTTLRGEVSIDSADRAAASRDASIFSETPQAVVAPLDGQDVCRLTQFAADHAKDKISLTARSAGTDMTGGPLSRSIVVDMKRHFTAIKRIGSAEAVAEPGVFYRDFEKETLKHRLLLPSYPASREICTIGGMVANNSGGEKSLVYGKTADFVKRLKVVLADGEEESIAPLRADQLAALKRRPSFLGRAVRRLDAILTKRARLIAAAKPQVSKNSAGYALWDIKRDPKIFDLPRLFVGSQGTLGIVTEITFRLIKPKTHSRLLVIFLPSLDELAQIINTVLTFHPESFESYDDQTLKLAVTYLPELIEQMHLGSILTLGWQFLPEAWMLASGGAPKLVLLAEFTGDSEAETLATAEAARSALAGYKVKTRITQSEAETQKYWVIRRESFNLLRHHVRHKHTAPFIDDLIVQPERLPEFLPELNEIMAGYKLTYTIAGHVGNGNFHIIPLMDFHDPATKRIIPELSRKVYNLVFQFHGSMTGEHNDGLIRSPYLRQMFGSEMYDLFKEVKHIFDPEGIFNPGKKIGGSLAENLSHLNPDT